MFEVKYFCIIDFESESAEPEARKRPTDVLQMSKH